MLLVWGIGWQQAALQPGFRLHAQADHHRLDNQLQDSAKQSLSTVVIGLGADKGMQCQNPKQHSWLPTVRWTAKRCGRANHSR